MLGIDNSPLMWACVFIYSLVLACLYAWMCCICVPLSMCASISVHTARPNLYMCSVCGCFIWCAYTPSCQAIAYSQHHYNVLYAIVGILFLVRASKHFHRCNICALVMVHEFSMASEKLEWENGFCFVQFKSRRLYSVRATTAMISNTNQRGVAHTRSLSIVGTVSVHIVVRFDQQQQHTTTQPPSLSSHRQRKLRQPLAAVVTIPDENLLHKN